MPADANQSSPLRWPGEWLRDQSFWRDVATRTLAGLIVALVIFAVGVTAGLVPAGVLWALLVMAAAMALLIALSVWSGVRLTKRLVGASRRRRRVLILAQYVVMLVAALAFSVVVRYATMWIRSAVATVPA